MPTYIMLANWTDQGLKAIADGPRRLDAAKKTLQEMGGHFHELYMTMGEFDLVGIYDAPDDAVAARYILLLWKCPHAIDEGFPGGGVSPDRQFPALTRRRSLNEPHQTATPHW